MTLRAYQEDVIERVRAVYRSGVRSCVLRLPTGAGKTHIAAALLRDAVARGKRAIFAAHRDDLVGTTLARVCAAGLRAGRVQAGERADSAASVQVCSIQTLHARPDECPPADLVILDECHRAAAPTVRGVLARYPDAYILGLTATPERADGQALGDVFGALVDGPSTSALIAEGVLVGCDVIAPATYSDSLACDPVDAVRTHGRGSTVVFCATVAEARRVASELSSAGYVDGDMPMRGRRDVLARFDRGDLAVLANCLVLTEGWDCPRADVCVLARGAGHASTYLQIVGRILRASPGKARALLVDLRGVVHLHGMPDDDRVYSLAVDPIRVAARLPPIRQCPRCGSVSRPAHACVRCSYVWPPPPPPRVFGRDIARTTVSPATRDEMHAFFRAQCALVRIRGWKPAAAGMRFKARYGFWPPWRSA